MKFQTLVHICSTLMLRSVARLHVEGAQHLQCEGALIVCANHLTRWDPPLIYMHMLRGVPIMPLIGEKWRKVWFFRWLFDRMDGAWIKPDEVDRDVLKRILTALKAGRPIGLAPEGTRSKTLAMQAAKPGAAWLAKASGVPVVPFALWGVEDIEPNLKRFRRTDVYVRIGEPFILPRNIDVQAGTDQIMCAIGRMLPEKYRGVYANQIAQTANEKQ